MAINVDDFAQRYIKVLPEFVEERVVMVFGVKNEVRKLQERLESVACLLEDAERRRLQDPAIDRWVAKLKDAMYDADDVVDLCRIKGAKRDRPPDDRASSTSSPSWMQSMRNVVSSLSSSASSLFSSYDIGRRIRDINDKLKEITEDELIISKLEKVGRHVEVRGVDPRQTSSLVETDLVGREIVTASRDLVELLVKEDGERCQVVAVVGMGGIGKTTLAQKVFSDQKMHHGFSLRAWLCVSQNFSETGLLKEMLRSFGFNYREAKTKAELQPMLRAAVLGKKVFVVLDDVWHGDVWIDLLRNPLQSGAACSRILITTRDLNVAMSVRASHVQKVKELPISTAWELLCKKVFAAGEEEEARHLKDVGIQIVEKCHGLPLAIKAIAGVLTTKWKCVQEWEKVLRNDAWNMHRLPEELRGALYLSYEDLPSHLKQCFLYCPLYPEDHRFAIFSVTQHFVAEGFIRGESSLVELAKDYLEELFRRSLLQPGTKEFGYYHFRMHDVLRSLAQFLSKDECFFGDAQRLKATTAAKIRRMPIAQRGDTATIPESILEQKCLRTLMLLNSPPRLSSDMLSKLSSLRVLVLNGPGTESIPDSIGNLIHLRCIDLYGSMVSQLPESLGRLKNLQVLNLGHCEHLHVLPRSITQIGNLLCLSAGKTPLRYVPKGIGRLEHLDVLRGFVVGDSATGQYSSEQLCCDLEELKPVAQLTYLSIYSLERAVTQVPGLLKDKTCLKTLYLECMPHHVVSAHEQRQFKDEEMNRIQGVYEDLFPPKSLEKLWIVNYFGRSLPNWMASLSLGTYFPILKYLHITGGKQQCRQLPPLGLLPQLLFLRIEDSSAVTRVGSEFLHGRGDDSDRATVSAIFPKLEVLRMENMSNWEEWSLNQEPVKQQQDTATRGPSHEPPMQLFPCMEGLVIKNCPKLRALPEGLQMTRMEALYIDHNHTIRTVENLPIVRLRVRDDSHLEKIANLRSLKNMQIQECPALQCLENLVMLERLELKDVSMEQLPLWLMRLIQQCQQQIWHNSIELVVECNIGVLQRCLKGRPDWAIIQQFPFVSVSADTKEKRAYLHYVQEPFHYETNV